MKHGMTFLLVIEAFLVLTFIPAIACRQAGSKEFRDAEVFDVGTTVDNDGEPRDAAVEDVSALLDGGAIFIDASGTWLGGACNVNADCTISSAAAADKRTCLNELYCLSGICHSDCTTTCVAVRSDVNPCLTPRLCTQVPGGGATSLCKITPIPCATAATCPQYRPVLPDGGQADWTCIDGICSYPGFEYPTE
jgi:hypothetical protein